MGPSDHTQTHAHTHTDLHAHPHADAHTHTDTIPETLPGASAPATVLSEIGGNRGAVVVHVSPDWRGREIEIRRIAEPWAGVHVAVLPRQLSAREDYSAFFPSLERGEYQVRDRWAAASAGPHSAPAEVRSVTVCGGAVTELDWDAAHSSEGHRVQA